MTFFRYSNQKILLKNLLDRVLTSSLCIKGLEMDESTLCRVKGVGFRVSYPAQDEWEHHHLVGDGWSLKRWGSFVLLKK